MRRAGAVTVVVLALSAGADLVLDAHVAFPGFYAVFGLVGAVAVILGSTALGALGLRRPDRAGPAGTDRAGTDRARADGDAADADRAGQPRAGEREADGG